MSACRKLNLLLIDSIWLQSSKFTMAFSICRHGAAINKNHDGKILPRLFFMLMKTIKMIKWALNCIAINVTPLAFSFVFFSCTELLRFYYWNINNCYKKCFLIFVPFLILSLCHNDVSLCNDRNLSKDTIHFSISFWWLPPPLLCF